MIFLLPYCEKDQQQALWWLEHVGRMGGCRSHSIVLMPARAIGDHRQAMELALAAFGTVDILRDAEGITGHPEGPNSMMRQAVWHMQMSNLGPWTFIEPDCIFLTSDAADTWDREYRAYGKPFMGEFRPASGVTPDYLSGNMVLPKGALLLAPMLSRRGLSKDGVELAFDIVAASQTLPQAHLTKLLHQVPKTEDGGGATFPDQASLARIRPGAVLFHPCKDGTLIERLREQRNGACVSGLNVSASRDAQEPGAERGLASSALRPEGSTPSAPIPKLIDLRGVDAKRILGCSQETDPVRLCSTRIGTPGWEAAPYEIRTVITSDKPGIEPGDRVLFSRCEQAQELVPWFPKPRSKRKPKKRQRTPAQVKADQERMVRVRAGKKVPA